MTRRDAGFLTVAEVATLLDVAVPTVTLWCRQGRFPGAWKAAGIRTPWLIPAGDLDDFIRPDLGRPVKAAAAI
jgi:excisionase family DNA binding protein